MAGSFSFSDMPPSLSRANSADNSFRNSQAPRKHGTALRAASDDGDFALIKAGVAMPRTSRPLLIWILTARHRLPQTSRLAPQIFPAQVYCDRLRCAVEDFAASTTPKDLTACGVVMCR
jgi:hypothetical protein